MANRKRDENVMNSALRDKSSNFCFLFKAIHHGDVGHVSKSSLFARLTLNLNEPAWKVRTRKLGMPLSPASLLRIRQAKSCARNVIVLQCQGDAFAAGEWQCMHA
jgi:hypothetical protein